jgi:hypothetical protein
MTCLSSLSMVAGLPPEEVTTLRRAPATPNLADKTPMP